MGIGKNHGEKDSKRALSNATVHKNGEIPILRGTDKDHKKGNLQMRTLCNAMMGPKKPLSEMVSDVLENMLDIDTPDICESTEGMIFSIEAYNNSKKINKKDGTKVLGSMDVKSLYSNIRTDEAAKIVKEEFIRSKVEFDGVDVDELAKALRLNLTTKEIDEKGLEMYLPFKRRKVKRKKSNRRQTSKLKDVDLNEVL